MVFVGVVRRSLGLGSTGREWRRFWRRQRRVDFLVSNSRVRDDTFTVCFASDSLRIKLAFLTGVRLLCFCAFSFSRGARSCVDCSQGEGQRYSTTWIGRDRGDGMGIFLYSTSVTRATRASSIP